MVEAGRFCQRSLYELPPAAGTPLSGQRMEAQQPGQASASAASEAAFLRNQAGWFESRDVEIKELISINPEMLPR